QVSGLVDYEQFTIGRAGAPAYSITKGVGWSASQNAFADVAVSGNDFTVTIYAQSGSALWSQTFSDAAPTPPTATPSASSATPTATLSVSTASPTATPGISTAAPTATTVAGTASPTAVAVTNTAVPTATSAVSTVVPSPTSGTTTATTVTYRSNPTYDGQILETSENSNQGGTINATATTFSLGDDSSNRQYRAILSFNTSGLPDNAVITAVTFKIKQAGSAGSNPYSTMGNIMADIITGPFSGSNSLQSADFQAASSRNAVMSIANTPTGGLYSKNMNSAYFGYINKTGVTQLRLRFATDDNNNGIADLLKFYTAETGTTTDRPTLVITYRVP
ncbi:MAG: DNRLRE domain-containing protein, partial [Anaerolineae bacterium]